MVSNKAYRIVRKKQIHRLKLRIIYSLKKKKIDVFSKPLAHMENPRSLFAILVDIIHWLPILALHPGRV